MAASSSSSRHLIHPHAPTAAPPPTPSTHTTSSTCSDAAETLSRLVHHLQPPSLSLPTRFSPRAAANKTTSPTTTATPIPTLSNLSPETIPAAFEAGFFQLDSEAHTIPAGLAESAELESAALFDLPREQKLSFVPKDWPLGFDDEDEDDDDEAVSFCMDGECSTTSEGGELEVGCMRELTRELEKVGMEVMESLACALGFENSPLGVGPRSSSSLMWISEGEKAGRVYPYVVGLMYQIRTRKYSVLADSDTVIVEPKVGSLFVTLGDIAQVWSNGKLKKVRGRPTPISEDKASKSKCISMTLLLTLPLESTVSPLTLSLKNSTKSADEVEDHQDSGKTTINEDEGENYHHHKVFSSFSFEDYAWRVYHERLLLKDPLDRYRFMLS